MNSIPIQQKRIALNPYSWSDTEHVIIISSDSEWYTPTHIKSFRVLMAQYIGSPEYKKYKSVERRDEMMYKAKEYLEQRGWGVLIKDEAYKERWRKSFKSGEIVDEFYI